MAEMSLSALMKVPKGVRAPPRTTISRSWMVINLTPCPLPWQGRGNQKGVRGTPLRCGAGVEAFAVLLAIAAGLHHAAQQRGRGVGRVGILFVDGFGSVEGGVEANVIQQL